MLDWIKGLWTPGVQDGVVASLIIAVIGAVLAYFYRGQVWRFLKAWPQHFLTLVRVFKDDMIMPSWLNVLIIMCMAGLGVGLGLVLNSGDSEQEAFTFIGSVWFSGCSIVLALTVVGYLRHWTEKSKSTISLNIRQAQLIKFFGTLHNQGQDRLSSKEISKGLNFSLLQVEAAIDQLIEIGLLKLSITIQYGNSYMLTPAGRQWLISNGYA